MNPKKLPKGWMKLTPKYIVIHISRENAILILQDWEKILKGELNGRATYLGGLIRRIKKKLGV